MLYNVYMYLEVTLLDGTVVQPQFDEDQKKEVVELYRKLAREGQIKAFRAEHQNREEDR